MQSRKVLVAAALAIMIGSSPTLADHSHSHTQGFEAYQNENYEEAYSIWKELAESGDANSQYNLGRLYAEGKGVAKSEMKAFYWMLLAAEAGNTQAQLNVTARYAMGLGVDHDHLKAYTWILISSAGAGFNEEQTESLITELTNVIGHIHHNLTDEERKLAKDAALQWKPH